MTRRLRPQMAADRLLQPTKGPFFFGQEKYPRDWRFY